MKTWIRNDSTGRYLLAEQPEENAFEESMMHTLQEENLLVPVIVYEDGVRCGCYPVTGLTAAGSWLSMHPLSAEALKGIVLQWNEAAETVAAHLLDEKNILWDRDSLYVNDDGRWVFLVCGSGKENTSADAVPWKGLTEELLRAVDTNDSEAVSLGIRLLQASMDKGQLHDLIRVLEDTPVQKELKETVQKPEGEIREDMGTLQEDFSSLSEEDAESYEEEDYMEDDGRNTDRRRSPGKQRRSRRAEAGRIGISSGILIRNVLVSQLVLAAALVFVYLIKGFDVMRRLLPLYIVLCVLTAAYFFVDALAHRDGN